MQIRPKTIICDIDGTIVVHTKPHKASCPETKIELLPGTLDKFLEWDSKGYNIILITGRKESLRNSTEKQLMEAGVFYDKLIMGIGGGCRVLINDMKEDGSETAISINLPRNKGISDLNL
jgi:hypothetical protein